MQTILSVLTFEIGVTVPENLIGVNYEPYRAKFENLIGRKSYI